MPRLVVGHRRAVRVALLFRDRQRLLEPALCLVQIVPLLGDDAELVVGLRRAVRVVLLFFDRQRLLVPALGWSKSRRSWAMTPSW